MANALKMLGKHDSICMTIARQELDTKTEEMVFENIDCNISKIIIKAPSNKRQKHSNGKYSNSQDSPIEGKAPYIIN